MNNETTLDEVVVDTFECLLPVRNFRVVAAVTKERQVPLTIEYALLLLKTLGWATIEDLQSYFGLTKKETGVLLHDLNSPGYVETEDGGLKLSQKGLQLFREDDGDPVITEVAEIDKVVTFDLLSVSLPLGKLSGQRHRPPFTITIDELPQDKEVAANIIERVRSSFQTDTFREFNDRFGEEKTLSLYSIDHIEPLNLRSLPMSVPLKASINSDVIVEPDFSELLEAGRIGRSREPIIHAIMQKIRMSSWPKDSKDAITWLSDFDHRLLSQFRSGSGFDLQACISFIQSGRKSTVVTEGVTKFFLGSSTSDGFLKAYDAIGEELLLAGNDRLIWVAPNYPLWGKGEQFEAIAKKLREGDGDAAFAIALKQDESPSREREERELAKQYKSHREQPFFDEMVLFARDTLPSSLEVILRPGKFAAVIVYVSQDGSDTLPLPLGFITTNQAVVRDIHRMVSDGLEARDKWTSAFKAKSVSTLYDKVHSIPPVENAVGASTSE
ncbi:MAG: hypothetical protein ACFHHU_00485 [Porticoccaceae bacterium]